MIRFTSDQVNVQAGAGDATGERRIDAIAVPYNTFATVSDGTEVMFKPGSLPVEGKAPRVFMYHDSSKPVGIVAERADTDEAMLASMKISRTALGDEGDSYLARFAECASGREATELFEELVARIERPDLAPIASDDVTVISVGYGPVAMPNAAIEGEGFRLAA